jgi:hypothetical protein
VPDPLPLVGEIDSQELSLDANHEPPEQPDGAPVTVTIWDPGALPTTAEAGEIRKLLQAIAPGAAWYTEKLFPAIVTLLDRACVALFCDQVTVTDPEPVPFDGETPSHEPLPDAVQLPPEQPTGETPRTVTTRAPAASLALAVEGEMENAEQT